MGTSTLANVTDSPLDLRAAITPVLDGAPPVGPARPSSVDRLRGWTPRPPAATAAIIGVAIAMAGAAFLARRLTDAGIAPSTVSFARYAMTALLLGRFLRLDRRRRRATLWGLGSGAALGTGWIAYVRAIEVGSVSSAGVVYMTYPLFALVATWSLFRVRAEPRQVVGGVLVLGAAVIGLGLDGDVPWVALVAPATFGTSIAILTERLGTLDPFERLAAVAGGATVALAPIILMEDRTAVVPGTLSTWLWMACLVLGAATIPMLVYACAAPQIGAGRAAIAGSVELPMVFVVGLILGETISGGQLVAAVLIGLAITISSTTRPAYAIPGEDLHRDAEPSPAPARGADPSPAASSPLRTDLA